MKATSIAAPSSRGRDKSYRALVRRKLERFAHLPLQVWRSLASQGRRMPAGNCTERRQRSGATSPETRARGTAPPGRCNLGANNRSGQHTRVNVAGISLPLKQMYHTPIIHPYTPYTPYTHTPHTPIHPIHPIHPSYTHTPHTAIHPSYTHTPHTPIIHPYTPYTPYTHAPMHPSYTHTPHTPITIMDSRDHNLKIFEMASKGEETIEGVRPSIHPFMFTCTHIMQTDRQTDRCMLRRWVNLSAHLMRQIVDFFSVSCCSDPSASSAWSALDASLCAVWIVGLLLPGASIADR